MPVFCKKRIESSVIYVSEHSFKLYNMDFFKSIFKIGLGRTPTLRTFPFKNKHYNSHRILHSAKLSSKGLLITHCTLILSRPRGSPLPSKIVWR